MSAYSLFSIRGIIDSDPAMYVSEVRCGLDEAV